MKATTRTTLDFPKDPREVEASFKEDTGHKANVTYVWADTEVYQSMKHPVENFSTSWVYELEWEV